MKRAYFAALLRVCLYFFEQSYYAEIKLVTTFDEKRQGYIVLSSWHGFPGGLRGVSCPERRSIGCRPLDQANTLVPNGVARIFSARQHAISRYMPSPVRPSVCSSVSQRRLKLGSRNLHHTVAP